MKTDTASSETSKESIPATGTSTKASKPNSKLIGMIVIILILAAVGAVSAKYLLVDPKKLLTDAIKKTSEAKSASLEARSDNGKFVLSGDLHDDEKKLSQLKVAINDIDNKPDEDITLGLKVNKTDMYVDMSYSNIDKVIGELSTLSYMKTYQLVYPVLKGQKSVHILIPDTKDKTKSTKESPAAGIEKTKKQFEEFGKKLQESVIIRKFDRSTAYKDKNYQRVTIGLDKVKLIAALESLKNMDIDVKVSQINGLIKVVNAVNNWDSDLVEFYVKDGYIAVITLSLPEIPAEALKDGLAESAKDDPSINTIFKNSTDKIESLFKPKVPGQLTKVGSIELSNFNSAPVAVIPTSVVEFDDILANAKVEVLPLVMPYLGQMMGMPQAPSPLMMPKSPTNKMTVPNFQIPNLPEEP